MIKGDSPIKAAERSDNDSTLIAPSRSIRWHVATVYGAYVINGVLSIIVIPLALKHFGTDGYGLYAIFGVLVSGCNLLGMGLHKHFSRLLAADRNPVTQAANLRVIFSIRLAISMLLFLMLPVLILVVPALLFPVSPQDIHLVRWLVVLAIVDYSLATPSDLLTFHCIANERIERYSKFVVISGLYRYGLMLLGVFVFAAPAPTVALLVCRRLLDPWVGRWVMGGCPAGSWRLQFDVSTFWNVIRKSTLVSLSEIGNVGLLNMGAILANATFGLTGMGAYRAAFDLTSRLWMISNGLGLVLFPRFAHLMSARSQSDRLMARMSGISDVSWAGYLVACTLGIWAAPLALPLLGFQYDVVQLFMLLLLGTGINAHATLSYQFLLAADKYLRASMAVLLGIVVMAATFVLLYSQLGILALGWSWIGSQLAYALAVDVQTRRYAGDSPMTMVRHVAFRLTATAATAATAAYMIASAPLAALAPSIICLISLSSAVYGLLAKPESTWEGHIA